MTWYVILFFAATLTGMAISVAAFGTGGKRKRVFRDIYFSVEDNDGIGVLYTKTGEYSAVLEIENPVQKYSADANRYYDFCHLLTAVAQTLGEGVSRRRTRRTRSSCHVPISPTLKAVPIPTRALILSSRRNRRKGSCIPSI